jgi:hypothetical protein
VTRGTGLPPTAEIMMGRAPFIDLTLEDEDEVVDLTVADEDSNSEIIKRDSHEEVE